MRRFDIPPRPDWQAKVESVGLLHHTADDGTPYWNESAFFAFEKPEIAAIESAVARLNELCLAAVDHVITRDRLADFGILDPRFQQFIRESWDRDEITIYGRYDLAYDGRGGAVKMLEFNADTPTSLLEAAIVQHYWREQLFPNRDQFNSLHERLVEAWSRVRTEYAADRVHFASGPDVEDVATVTYLRDTAHQAGLDTTFLYVHEIGHDGRTFVDSGGAPIEQLCKLYPWEWMLREPFAEQLLTSETMWLEPPWKMLLSNKTILAVLWELFPGEPNLLEASMNPLGGDEVRKPVLGREGANVAIDGPGGVYETDGPYDGPFVYQRRAELARFGDLHAILGAWTVNGWPCGMGVREDDGPVTGNLARFVPHVC
jgi:glutathionylspermidine synthase